MVIIMVIKCDIICCVLTPAKVVVDNQCVIYCKGLKLLFNILWDDGVSQVVFQYHPSCRKLHGGHFWTLRKWSRGMGA